MQTAFWQTLGKSEMVLWNEISNIQSDDFHVPDHPEKLRGSISDLKNLKTGQSFVPR